MKNKPPKDTIGKKMTLEKVNTRNMNPKLNNDQAHLLKRMRAASKKIAPLWPLERFVAVNPFLGLSGERFEKVAMDLESAAGIRMTLPRKFYLRKIEEGMISDKHLSKVLSNKGRAESPKEFIEKTKALDSGKDLSNQLPKLAEIASRLSGKDWKRFVTARVSRWAASYFDQGQASWKAADQELSPFESWKQEAKLDLSPDLSGLKGFRKFAKSLPNNALEAAEIGLNKLGIEENELDRYLHSLLLRFGGWAAYAAQIDWEVELYGGKDGITIEFLVILICWEAGLMEGIDHPKLKEKWFEAKLQFSGENKLAELNELLASKLILQEAFDLAAQEELIEKFEKTEPFKSSDKQRAKGQAIFCIDVRSEVYRRNLEKVDEEIETIGFAGFFAFPIKYVPLGHEDGEAQCPVLLPTGPNIKEELGDQESTQKALQKRLSNQHFQQLWKSFKSGAVSCFSFVSPLGLCYLPKLITDSFGLSRPVAHPDATGISKKDFLNRKVSLKESVNESMSYGIPLKQQIDIAKNALTAMSLKTDFARFVLIAGHGSSMVNNPHATGYDCGACGGHSGEANAKVASAVLNNTKVRKALKEVGILIPEDTIFLAGLHNTTTDEVSISNEYDIPQDRKTEFDDFKRSLDLATFNTRAERSHRMPKASGADAHKDILMRSKDWSQTRPEWGLAGCSAFVVAPRERSLKIDLGGKSFLHSYDWKEDQDFAVLELIMTAPMVVTNWINLQYFASAVDNRILGSGNKTLHNVTAGLGVLEGFSGDLRVGLPWQSVHDGEKYQHEPLKLNVVIEAPIEAMNAILEKHQGVKDLCDNGWMHLLAMNENGKIAHRYTGDLKWESTKLKAA